MTCVPRLLILKLLMLTTLLSCGGKPDICAAQSAANQSQAAIELTLVDDQAIAYATFQSHNQKVVANDQGVFIAYVRTANADYTGQLWRLARSEDGGKSFVTALEETRATSAPALETDQGGRLFFGRPDFKSGNAYLSRLDSLDVQPSTTTLAGGSAGKYCMALDEPRKQIYYFAHNGTFHVVGVYGKVEQTTQLLAHGKRAALMYPHLTLGRDGTLYAAWTTQQTGKYLYRSIHAMKSTDGGASWQTLDGRPIAPPIVADDEGPSTHVTRDDELDVHSWLSAFMAKDDKLHLAYWAETSPQRQRYLRFDGATGKKEVDVARMFSEREMSEPNDSGVFVANRSMPGSPLYFVSTIDDRKRLACLVSEDNGRTWSEFAISDEKFKNRIYSIGAARDVTRDGWIVGTFTDVADGAKTYYEPNSGRVYFFRIRVRSPQLRADDSWRQPFEPDEHTVVLYHFNEGAGNETHDALGDKSLTLRANKRGLWGRRDGFGATARFERKDDDPNLLVGPANHDKLHLRHCTKAWTIELWAKYEGKGGLDTGRTALNLCGTDDEGFSLPTGLRGGWSFGLHSKSGKGTIKDGIIPWARFMGSPRGKDPNHDTSGILLPYVTPGFTDAKPAVITDNDWHHVAWQFRYQDQTHFFFVDGRLVRRVQLPITDENRIVVNDAVDVGVPFVVGGFPHSQDPPFNLNWGTFEGQIDELRISSVMRYPVSKRLAIVRQKLPEASVNIPYSVTLGTDAARGDIMWKIVDGRLPRELTLEASDARIHGTPTMSGPSTAFTIEARDESGASDSHRFEMKVAKGELLTESLQPAFVGVPYRAELNTGHLAAPLKWEIVKGKLPTGIETVVVASSRHHKSGRRQDATATKAALRGTPRTEGWTPLTIQVTDANGESRQRDVVLKALPKKLIEIKPDKHTVALFDWQGPNGKLIPDRMGEESHTLTWTNMGGDRRVAWPGREKKFPQFTGHGEHGFATAGKGPPKLDFKTCERQWTLEVWVRRGGPLQAFGGTVRGKHSPFHYGHVCGTYDKTKRGVWELYLCDTESTDGSMAPGIHFFGAAEDQTLENLDPWHRPQGIVGDRSDAGIRDTEWHHVAWQYNYAEDLHELFLDGRLIWKMQSPDGRKLVNNRKHDAQFSVSTRLTGYSRYGGSFNYLGEGNFFGQIGEIRISNVRRYGR